MLVLTRKLGEDILIGKDISVKVIAVDHNKVQLGIQAPHSVTIYRQELVEKVKKQNQSSLLSRRYELIEAARKLKQMWGIT